MNNLCSPGDVGFQPCIRHARKVYRKALKKDSVVHSIKRCTDIEEGDEVDLVLISGRVNVRKDSKVQLFRWNDICGTRIDILKAID